MGWFGFGGGKDWNVIAFIFEKPDLYRINGQRAKGGEAQTLRENVKNHPRTIFSAVFDQKGAYLEGEPGPGAKSVPNKVLERLIREVHTLQTVRQVLTTLEKGEQNKLAKALEWNGYPPKEERKG